MANNLENTVKTLNLLNAELKQKQTDLSNQINGQVKLKDLMEIEYLTQIKIREEADLIVQAKTKTTELTQGESDALKDVVKTEKEINTELDKGIKRRQRIVDLGKALGRELKLGWQYLQEQDKIIKSTVLNLGMSGAKAVAMRDSFEQSAGFVARLGGNLVDIQNIMQGFADETGRARTMTASMVEDITSIGKGTGLGIEAATQLGAQFELMGLDTRKTMEYVQGVVDTSERMGVNTTKVLKNINTNFKKLNTYTFQQGVKGMAEMAIYAEKFKIDIGQALNAADVARSLDGAIDLAAQLQIMGGEFAKTDPFEMLFLSRNDPAKFTKKIGDMTKGVVSFRKMADGSFEKYISPADRDRLAAVAKSMGMEAGAMTEIAERQAEIQKMRQQTAGIGLSPKERDIIEGAALFDSKSGKFQVQIAGSMKSIGELTKTQAKSFASEQSLLAERAKQAMTFDETFQATINILKTALLPLLNSINSLLEVTVKPLADLAAKGGWGLASAASILLVAGGVWKTITFGLNQAAKSFVAGRAGRAAAKNGNADLGKTISSNGGKSYGSQMAGKGKMMAGKGKMAAGIGAGVGAAALGVGAGIGAAAAGVSLLADSMSKLSVEKAKVLNNIVSTLGWFVAGGAAIAASVILLGKSAEVSAAGLGMLAVTALGVGAGIGIAAAGVGAMGLGLSYMFESVKGAGSDMLDAAGGIGAIAASVSLMGNPFAIAGLAVFAGTMATINSKSAGVAKTTANIEKMAIAMKGSKDDWIAVQNAITTIENSNINKGNMFSKLTDMLTKPLIVKFDKTSIQLKNDVSLAINKDTFMRKVFDAEIAVQMINDMNTRGILPN